MKFPRTVRFDASDANAFPEAADAGEWAVTGTSAFAHSDPEAMSNKERLAFRNGWLGTASFGRATFIEVVEMSEQEHEAVVSVLAEYLVEHFGAPNLESARNAARGETEYTAGLCDHPIGTMLGIEREFTDDGISERIRVFPKPEEGLHAKIWTVEEDENEG